MDRDAVTSSRLAEMTPVGHGLSKSRLTAFEQCPKRLWLSVHGRGLGEHGAGSQARMAAGHEVGEAACGLLPDGIMVDAKPDLAAAVRTTRALIDQGVRRPIFEATFEHDGLLVRVDVLEPEGDDGWRMAEVKSTTSAKAYHLADLATQVWVARETGLTISSAAIRHIDSRFVLETPGSFEGLFADTECLETAGPLIEARPAVAALARATLAGDIPSREPGEHCRTPFACEFETWCRADLAPGPEWPVTILPNGGGRRWMEAGIEDLLSVDDDALTSASHRRIVEATRTGKTFHDEAAARAAIEAWAWPRSWLDFETIAFAVPRWPGTRPYQQTPFQYSVHVEHEDGSIRHEAFLSLDGQDPRRACAEALVRHLPAEGAVIGYNASFERSRILELAEAFPDLREALEGMAVRIVDLLPVTRACWYHRDQRGSWSIKAVLPTIAPELDYGALDVKDGGQAQEAWLEIVRGTTDERRTQLETGLLTYCRRDTEAMIVLADRLCGRAPRGIAGPERSPEVHPSTI